MLNPDGAWNALGNANKESWLLFYPIAFLKSGERVWKYGVLLCFIAEAISAEGDDKTSTINIYIKNCPGNSRAVLLSGKLKSLCMHYSCAFKRLIKNCSPPNPYFTGLFFSSIPALYPARKRNFERHKLLLINNNKLLTIEPIDNEGLPCWVGKCPWGNLQNYNAFWRYRVRLGDPLCKMKKVDLISRLIKKYLSK